MKKKECGLDAEPCDCPEHQYTETDVRMLKDVVFEADIDQLALVLFHECRHQSESGKGIARIREELVKMYELGKKQV